MSDVRLEPEKGLVGHGKVLPSISFIKDADINLGIDGDEISLRKIFNTTDFNMGKIPFLKITDSSLEVFAGESGLGLE